MVPNSMIELFFSLPDEKLADLMIYHPEVIENMCIGLTIELNILEKNEDISNRRMLH
jgi:hypothetical protein